MATLVNVEEKLHQDPAFIGQLMVNPMQALTDANLMLTDSNDAKRLERMILSLQKELTTAGQLAAFNANAQANWGIGMGCCNSACLQQYDTSGACGQ